MRALVGVAPPTLVKMTPFLAKITHSPGLAGSFLAKNWPFLAKKQGVTPCFLAFFQIKFEKMAYFWAIFSKMAPFLKTPIPRPFRPRKT